MKCALCQSGEAKQDSHIIPAFVGRWLKESSPTGFLRRTVEPNKRTQDLTKEPLLCAACEERFSKLETVFANKVFREVCQKGNGALAFDYSEWLAQFCVSISWRSLTHLARSQGLKDLPHGHSAYIGAALENWRLFLLGKSADIGSYRQHFLILDTPTSGTAMNAKELAAMSRYIKRAVDLNTMHARGECYIFSKLCDILIVGTVLDDNPQQWGRTEVQLKGGRYEPGSFQVSGCFTVFFNTAIEEVRKGLDAISEAQTSKIIASFLKKQGRRR